MYTLHNVAAKEHTLVLSEEEFEDFRKIIFRATNTWDKAPRWAIELANSFAGIPMETFLANSKAIEPAPLLQKPKSKYLKPTIDMCFIPDENGYPRLHQRYVNPSIMDAGGSPSDAGWWEVPNIDLPSQGVME